MHRRSILILILLAAMLVACGGDPAPASTPIATAPPQAANPRPSGGGVVASGQVVPGQEAQLAFILSGRVQAVEVAVGDVVQPGEILATLDTSTIETNIAQAEAVLEAARANLDRLLAGARPEEIAAAEQSVATARAQVAQAEAAQASAEAQCAVAQSGIGAAQAALQAAQAQYHRLDSGPSEAAISAAQAEVRLAEAQLRQAQGAYDRIKDSPDIQMRPEALALEQATIAWEAAQAQYAALFEGAAKEDREAAAAQVEAARVQVAQAEGQAQAACAQIEQASSAVEAARSQQIQAEQQVALLKSGATTEERAGADAQVAQAEAALEAARNALEQTNLRAPFAGTVTALEIGPGEAVLPGQAVLALADLAHLRAETTDLSERDVARVTPGQETLVYVEALGQEIQGRVAGIAPQANTLGGDVVYTIYVDLDQQPSGLRWGMSVEVQIITD